MAEIKPLCMVCTCLTSTTDFLVFKYKCFSINAKFDICVNK